jgi:hypothetical protein
VTLIETKDERGDLSLIVMAGLAPAIHVFISSELPRCGCLAIGGA